MKTKKIDVVIPWVDSLDKDWQKSKKQYLTKDISYDSREARYRDWDNLKYIFRGIEKNMPWVNKVYFITSGHLPSWLNTNNNKLVCIKHSKYIPKKYLPTFSSHPIEHNLSRIEELSEQFIYFNDDMFVVNPLKEELFFKDNLPVYPAILHANTSSDKSEIMQHIYLNNNIVINRHFDLNDVLKNKQKWFSIKNNGLRSVIENIFNSKYPQIIGIYNSHLPTPFLKSTLKEVWDEEYDILDKTSKNRFRSKDDVSQYLYRYWQLCKGDFMPINPKKLGKEININIKTIDDICNCIENKETNMLCLNDSDEVIDDKEFNMLKQRIINSFERIYPEKSGFEK